MNNLNANASAFMWHNPQTLPPPSPVQQQQPVQQQSVQQQSVQQQAVQQQAVQQQGAAGAAPGNGAAAPRARHAAAAQVRWQQEQLQLRAEPGGRHDESRQSRRRRRSHERLWQLPGPVSQALPDQHIQHRLLSDQR